MIILDQDLDFSLRLKLRSLVDDTLLSPGRKLLIQTIRDVTRARLANLPQTEAITVTFGILADPQVNGVALLLPHQGKPLRFCGVTAGAVLYLYEFFNYILSRPDVLQSLGNSSLEINQPLAFRPTACYPCSWPTIENSVVPRCPTRATLASHLSSIALNVLTEHEIAHAACGHIREASEFSERTTPAPNFSLRRHAMEMCADRLSISRTLDLELERIRQGPPAITDLYDSQGSRQPSVYAICLCMGLLLRLLAPDDSPLLTGEVLRTGHHPYQAIRWRYLLEELGSCLVDKRLLPSFKNVDHPLRSEARRGIQDSITIWSTLTGKDWSPDFWILEASPELSREPLKTQIDLYLFDLHQQWTELIPQLQEHSLVPLPDYQNSHTNT